MWVLGGKLGRCTSVFQWEKCVKCASYIRSNIGVPDLEITSIQNVSTGTRPG
jgi:hypothetical protein